MELKKQKRIPMFSYIVACVLNSSFKIVEYILYQFTWLTLIQEIKQVAVIILHKQVTWLSNVVSVETNLSNQYGQNPRRFVVMIFLKESLRYSLSQHEKFKILQSSHCSNLLYSQLTQVQYGKIVDLNYYVFFFIFVHKIIAYNFKTRQWDAILILLKLTLLISPKLTLTVPELLNEQLGAMFR